MGIKNLNKFIRDTCPDVYDNIHISEYAFKKIAVDVSLYLCKFKSIAGDKWFSLFINLIACLRKNEVHCVFCYDNGAPPDKEQERKERAEQRAKNEEKIYKLEEAVEKFNLTNEIDQILIDFYKKKTKSDSNNLHKRLLGRNDNNNIDMNFVISAVEKMKSQILSITSEDFQLTKKLFDILKVPYYDAPLEAETSCADLCKRGIVDAVLSEDTDVLAYGSPVFLSKINTYNGTCTRIQYPNLLEKLSLQPSQFLDFCIMCGTDYNKNIFRVGPKKAYQHIQQYNNIEGIQNNTTLDISVLKHIRVRQLFTEYEKKNIKVLYCGTPDFQKLTDFVFKKNLPINVDGLKKSFTQSNVIIFEDDDDEDKNHKDDNNEDDNNEDEDNNDCK